MPLTPERKAEITYAMCVESMIGKRIVRPAELRRQIGNLVKSPFGKKLNLTEEEATELFREMLTKATDHMFSSNPDDQEPVREHDNGHDGNDYGPGQHGYGGGH